MSYSSIYEPVIGLEIHAQLMTQSKLFSAEGVSFDAADNENISTVSIGLPGTLPVVNKKAIELAIKAGIALNCHIRDNSIFARKNYFYPDLPKGYQISQFEIPLCENGFFEYDMPEIGKKIIRIKRAHLEEDAGKSTHYGDYSLLNYNRSGVPLLEIVSEPDFRSPLEAAEYGRNLRLLLMYLEVCDGNLEQGSFRCDCNVSVRLKGETSLGTKVEIKNLNSFRFVEKAIEFEIERQIDLLERKVPILQETRLYDPDKNKTYSMRSKEDSQDYRYFPDPDLLPLKLSQEWVEKNRIPQSELPQAKKNKYISEYQLSAQDAEVIISDKDLCCYFEKVIHCQSYDSRTSVQPKQIANWVRTEIMKEAHFHQIPFSKIPIPPQQLYALLQMVEKNIISGKIAKTVMVQMWSSGKMAEEIVKDMNLQQITDPNQIDNLVLQVLNQNAKAVEEYKKGKTKLFGFFVGEIMKLTKGKANPELVNQIVKEKLSDG